MDGNCASDLMAVLSSARWSPFKHGSPMAVTVAISTYLFPVVAVLSSIPVFRYGASLVPVCKHGCSRVLSLSLSLTHTHTHTHIVAPFCMHFAAL